MRRGRPKAGLFLSAEERIELTLGARAAHSTQAYALRCRIVLACADGDANVDVAARFGVSPATVGKWRARFAAHRIAGLADEPRSGRPPVVGPDVVEQVLAATMQSPPADAARWTRTSMAAHTGLSASTVGRIWQRHDLRPHEQEGLWLPADPDFTARVVAVAGLYRRPTHSALALCTAEPPPAAGRPPHPAPAPPGTTTGQQPRRIGGYRGFLTAVDRTVPESLAVHLVCDCPDLHRGAALRRWLAQRPRFRVHVTPAGAPWAEQVERWFARLGGPVPAAAAQIVTAAPTPAGDPRPLVWLATPEALRRALDRHRERTSDATAPDG